MSLQQSKTIVSEHTNRSTLLQQPSLLVKLRPKASKAVRSYKLSRGCFETGGSKASAAVESKKLSKPDEALCHPQYILPGSKQTSRTKTTQ